MIKTGVYRVRNTIYNLQYNNKSRDFEKEDHALPLTSVQPRPYRPRLPDDSILALQHRSQQE